METKEEKYDIFDKLNPNRDEIFKTILGLKEKECSSVYKYHLLQAFSKGKGESIIRLAIAKDISIEDSEVIFNLLETTVEKAMKKRRSGSTLTRTKKPAIIDQKLIDEMSHNKIIELLKLAYPKTDEKTITRIAEKCSNYKLAYIYYSFDFETNTLRDKEDFARILNISVKQCENGLRNSRFRLNEYFGYRGDYGYYKGRNISIISHKLLKKEPGVKKEITLNTLRIKLRKSALLSFLNKPVIYDTFKNINKNKRVIDLVTEHFSKEFVLNIAKEISKETYEVFKLNLDGLSKEEIAQIMLLGESSVKVYLTSCRKKIAEEIINKGIVRVQKQRKVRPRTVHKL